MRRHIYQKKRCNNVERCICIGPSHYVQHTVYIRWKSERMIKKITTTATKDACGFSLFLRCYPVLNAIHDTFKHTHTHTERYAQAHSTRDDIFNKPQCKEQYGKTKWTKWNNALSSGNCEMNEFFYTWAKWIGLCRTYAGCLLLDALCLCLFAFFSRIIICLCVAVDICSLALIFPHFYSSVVRFWVRFPFDTSPFFCHLYSFFFVIFCVFFVEM